ncbi:MAG: hypothetical protein AAGI63_05120 [Planctomycetota bacterium]
MTNRVWYIALGVIACSTVIPLVISFILPERLWHVVGKPAVLTASVAVFCLAYRWEGDVTVERAENRDSPDD